MKKLKQLEGMFMTKKEILGWIFDGEEYTISLPHDKGNNIKSTIKTILKHKTIARHNLENYKAN